jgi:large subunit ribosomal protein L21
MKIAVIKSGGKQYLVEVGKKIKVEKLAVQAGEKINLETLLIADGEALEIGAPVLDSPVEAQVVGQGRHRKVIGIKYKPKTRQQKKFGQRQNFTELAISKI